MCIFTQIPLKPMVPGSVHPLKDGLSSGDLCSTVAVYFLSYTIIPRTVDTYSLVLHPTFMLSVPLLQQVVAAPVLVVGVGPCPL